MLDFFKLNNIPNALEGFDLTNPSVVLWLAEHGSDEQLGALFKQGVHECLFTRRKEKEFYELALRNPQSKKCFSCFLKARRGGGTEENLGINPLFLGEVLGEVFEEKKHNFRMQEIVQHMFEYYKNNKSSYGRFVLTYVCRQALRKTHSMHLAQTMIDCDASKVLRGVFWDGVYTQGATAQGFGKHCLFVLQNPGYFKFSSKDQHLLFLLDLLHADNSNDKNGGDGENTQTRKKRWGDVKPLQRQKALKKLGNEVRRWACGESFDRLEKESFCLDHIVSELDEDEILLLGTSISEDNFHCLTQSSSFVEYFYSLKEKKTLLHALSSRALHSHASATKETNTTVFPASKRKM